MKTDTAHLPSRRAFLGKTGVLAAAPLIHAAQPPRPNILWLTAEDMGPHLRVCGDEYSITPNLDKLAGRGCLYNNAWSNAPVCAPARTTIISGVYPPSTGSEHMRSMTSMPSGWKMFPEYLREAGYYCSNNNKEDYNLAKPEGTWDDSSRKGHWRNRGARQPFFSVFNHEITHESRIRMRSGNLIHDPAKARIPAYHPDTPEVRRDWAQYYDNITTMDTQVAARLQELETDGLAEDTIVFFYGDHGSGMPRNKRFPYDSGLHVCIVAAIPEKFRHLAPKDYIAGGRNNRLVGFVDLAPTMLSLAGLKAPEFYQGQAFMGRHEAPPRTYCFGFRGRMDERFDLMRTVRDKRHVYVRNYNPHKIYGQYIAFMWGTPTTAVWDRLYREGKLTPPQTHFWETKPAEELYDLENDRDEVKNLATSAEHKATLERFRKAHREHELRIRDVGLLPEADVHARAKGSSPYEMGHDPNRYPVERVLAAAELASSLKPGITGQLAKAMQDPDGGVRYWGVMGALMRGAEEVASLHAGLSKALEDASPSVRIASAEALGRYGKEEDLEKVLPLLIELADPVKNGSYVAMHALNAIEALGKKAASLKEQLKALPTADPNSPARVRSEYTTNLVRRLIQTL
ncbi:MAG TPA: sulfatase-like hydrolase/transferase [Bryobacteraceae bacterium]|nr:sulfatase-like hydrolase/transferase [Bryobacteraceae bacterium]